MMKKCFMSLAALCLAFGAQAHPHAFVDMQSKVLVENQQLVGFSMQWVLDEPSSAAVLYDLKQARGDKAAMKKLVDEMMDNIVAEHYFSYLYDKQGKKIKYQSQVRNPEMKSNGTQVSYHFDFLLSKAQPLQQAEYQLLTYDPTYYVSMYYDEPTAKAVDFSQLPTQCKGAVLEPNVDEKMRNYAASLDKNQRDEDSSLGEVFAQKVKIQCE